MREKDSFQLKCIALLCMTIDHAAHLFLPKGTLLYYLLRMIGRQAFPIYCFMIAEGDAHTRSHVRYMGRLLLFALLSEIPYDLVAYHTWWSTAGQNVFFTLFLGEAALYGCSLVRDWERKADSWPGVSYNIWIGNASGNDLLGILIRVAVIVAAMMAAMVLHTDYGEMGVLLIVVLAGLRLQGTRGLAAAALICALGYWRNWLQLSAIFAFLVILPLYNGQRGREGGKILFYAYYPLHLLVLWGLSLVVK